MRSAFLAGLFVLAIAGSVAADGVLVPRPFPGMPPRARIDVKYHHVDVEINDPVAVTKIDQVFVNPYHRELEADYIFPIPEKASITRFTAWLGGHKMEGELLDADQARRIYEDIVRRHKDPALLEYTGRGLYRLRVYPIPARGEVRVKLEYEETLESDLGTVDYLYPLNTEKHSGSNLEECRINISVKSFQNIHFTRQANDFGFHMLSYKEPGDGDGYFLGIIAPPVGNDFKNVSKNVIFLLDSSGSMRGEKMKQAVDALKFCLLGLDEDDGFAIFDYDETVKPYKPEIISATGGNIESAIAFSDRIEASGGTNIYQALAEACGIIPRGDDPTYIIFLTDGLPTVGNTDIEQIIQNTTRLNEGRARLFAFGVGYDVNAHLLDRLTEGNKGVSEYVAPTEDIEAKVSRFAGKISRPAMTDLTLAFNPKETYDVYPQTIPDLFNGSEIIVTGRFRDSGSSNAILKGKIGKDEKVYEFPVKFGDGSSRDEYVAMIWANRRIGHLLQQMRLHGVSDELLSEVVRLSKKFGIVTEYTSYLVTGDELRRHDDFWRMPLSSAKKTLRGRMQVLSEDQSGSSAFNQSKNLGSQNRAAQAPQPGEVFMGDERKTFTNIAQVGNQAFFQSGKNWIQSNLEGNSYDIEIKPYSRAYFQLLENDPSLGRFLALGDEVRFQVGSQIVQIAEGGKKILTDDELKMLFLN
jgi:Ca-activated chloride channel family protein